MNRELELYKTLNTSSDLGPKFAEKVLHEAKSRHQKLDKRNIFNTQTKLIKQAIKLGIPNLNGLDMLLYQGCDAFKFWTGIPAPEDIMQQTLLNLVK